MSMTRQSAEQISRRVELRFFGPARGRHGRRAPTRTTWESVVFRRRRALGRRGRRPSSPVARHRVSSPPDR